VRISRPRVLLRVALLVAGGFYMLWRAMQAWRASGELEAGAATLQSRLAVLAALIGTLALLTALGAALSLRRRKRGGSLRLGPPRADPREP
jgi:threonine/homoserine/homoserine lactone efflux protein